MAEKKSVGHAYNVDFLNVVFAASSVFLFLCVIWMVWDDYDREWKNTQRRFTQLEMEVTRQELAAAEQGIDRNRLAALEQERAAAEQALAANQGKVDELQAQLAEISIRLDRDTQDYQFAKATYDVDRYDYEVERKEGRTTPEDDQAIQAQAAEVAELNLRMEQTTTERDALRDQLSEFTGQVAGAQSQIDELLGEQRRLQDRLRTIAPSFAKTFIRDAPMTDFMAPTIKVAQIMLPNVVDDVNFTRVPKMDRCTTCHLAIDRAGYEEYPQPFRTHPNLSAYVGSDSPHPLNQVGCTVCHDGMGQSVDFTHVAHTPRNEEQAAQWEEQYHWHPTHFWDYPMLPVGMTEASCAKCHREEIYVPTGDVLAEAYGLYERAGCYACHKTRGFEGLRKPGPDLRLAASKLTPEWVENWVREPRAMKPATWMPQVWYNSNSNAPEDAPRNEAELRAAVAYLFNQSGTFTPEVADPPMGNVEAGRALVESAGCLGCHITGETDRETAGPRRTFGQPLQGIGSKTTYAWLYDWVRDPMHYSPGTFMPDLRLTSTEAANVAAYLFSLKGPAGTAAPVSPDQAVVDEVLLGYLRAVMPTSEAQSKIASMDAQAKQLDLGQRVIARYGCFSCHEIAGFEDTQAIGVDLSEQGSKLVTRLDFAHVDIPHTKLAWFEQKLADPRSFDQGRVLTPEEKLRMPNFHLSERENELLRTALMSFQRYVQPDAALPPRNARRDFLVQGRALVHRQNCVGCHTIEGAGGDFVSLVEDPSLGPPLLTPEGARVQADWLYAFLRSPIQIRPWLDVRMPSFGLNDDRWNEVIGYFQAIPNQLRPFRTVEMAQTSAADAATGKELFDLLRCQQCHVLGEIPADQPTANLAPDLRMGHERLNPEWMDEWMISPLRIVPGTRMPMFWPNYPKSDFPQFGGDAQRQIEAVRNHIMSFRGGPSPNRSPGSSMAAD
ncbi:MAG: c-type cytochrome [Acidimicrobiia bacterium]|nr:c-type cytochrome [Acidimicrobiia bacterium]